MPAFNFDNQWLDVKFNPASGSSDDNGSSPGSGSQKPVFSGYGVIFIAVSTLLTCLTVSAYFYQKSRATRKHEDEPTNGKDELWYKSAETWA